MNVETANRLMQLRKKAGLSQEELADKLGVSRQAVSKWESAESSPDTDNLIALSKIYGVTLDELVNGVDETKEKEKEEKKPFIHIKGKDKEVEIGNAKIHVVDGSGEEVHIDTDGIHIKTNKNIDDDDGDDDDDDIVDVKMKDVEDIHWRKKGKWGLMEKIADSITPLLVVIAYLLCGFLLPNGWSHYWVLFFLIPIVPTLIKAIDKRRFCVFAYPVLVVGVYLTLGMFFGLWHPMWILFITIPVYYSCFGPLDAYMHRRKKIVIDAK